MTRRPLLRLLLAATLAGATLACSRPGGAPDSQRASAAATSAAPSDERSVGERRATVPAEPRRAEREVLPAGTRVAVRLDASVSSASAAPGQRVAAELAAPLAVGNDEVAAVGTPVEVTVASAVPSGRLSGRAELALTLTGLTLSGRRLAVVTDTLSRTGPAHTRRNEKMIGGGAVIGALAGQLLGGHTRDTLRGAALGAAAGTGVAAAHGRLDVTLGAGRVVRFTLAEELVIPR